MKGLCVQLGVVTTPQLHFAVQHMNGTLANHPHGDVQLLDLDDVYIRQYATRFSSGLCRLMSRPDKIYNSAGSFVDLHVDCAHGVGGIALSKLNAALGSGDSPHKLRLHLYNLETDKPELLNLECGADFVKISSQAPTIHFVHSNVPRSATDRWATIDGDADRLLYFYHDYSAECPRRIVLLDGDRIACLFASFFTQLLNFTRSEHQLTVGVIQTAYANTGSTAYLRNTLSVSVKCVPTGVKHLHHAARDFDIGIYFEANGHGTVLYSTAALNYIRTLDAEHPLAIFYALTNTAVGDAITDILLVEYALAWHTWSLFDWAALYTESASRQVKVGVKDPSLIQTTDAERRVSSPAALQVNFNLSILRLYLSLTSIASVRVGLPLILSSASTVDSVALLRVTRM
ncbi:unnamed protein product [Dicrocoelium dendriticum]|nr:unnamed protein product [Dicrocoelium dendriticum]